MDLIEQIAQDIFNSKQKGELNADLLKHYANKLLEAMNQGYGSVETLSYKDKAIVEALAGNIYQFSGAKSWHELNELNQLLTDKNGDIKDWDIFYKEVKAVHKTYNDHYLATEYQFAINSSLMIKRWNEFYAEKESFPYLKYDAVLDGRTRDSHARLSGIVKPINDPFWNTFYPPLGWNCRCEVLQTSEASAEELKKGIPEIIIPEAFKNNPAKDKKIFSEESPYFKHLPKDKKELLSFKNLSHLINSPLLKNLMDREEKGGYYERKNVFVENNCEKETEFESNLKTATILASKWKKEVRLKAPLIRNQFNHDAEIDNKRFEFKDLETANFNTLDKHLQKAKKQVENIVFNLGKDIAKEDLIKAFEKRMSKSKSWDSFTVIKGKKVLKIEQTMGTPKEWIKKIENIYR